MLVYVRIQTTPAASVTAGVNCLGGALLRVDWKYEKFGCKRLFPAHLISGSRDTCILQELQRLTVEYWHASRTLTGLDRKQVQPSQQAENALE